MMNESRESDALVVPVKFPNEASAEEGMEERGAAKGSPLQQNTLRTQSRDRVQNALERVREASERDKKARLTSVFHHIANVDALREAFYGLKRSAAPGVDGNTWAGYAENLETNLEDLRERLRRGSYRARPVRRVFIPKADGSQRPLGVPTIEDKIVQSAAAAVLNAMYEPLFHGFSYGFRPGRSQHHALDALNVGIIRKKVSWVLDADIRGYFDAIDHERLVALLERRIGDPRLLRLIQKWLKAGVMEGQDLIEAKAGTPQGGSVSPILANIYLHYAFDCWATQWRKKTAQGDVMLVRYADDCIAGFQHLGEANRFLSELQQNYRTYGLELHPEKTRILEFGRFAATNRQKRGERKPETFEFLGFTHICGRSRRSGKFQVQRRTSKKRMVRKLNELKEELRRRMHRSIPELGQWLASVVRGHNRYYGVPLNYKALQTFRNELVRLWMRTLRRRSHKSTITWERMGRLVSIYLPRPKIVHPYPYERLVV